MNRMNKNFIKFSVWFFFDASNGYSLQTAGSVEAAINATCAHGQSERGVGTVAPSLYSRHPFTSVLCASFYCKLLQPALSLWIFSGSRIAGVCYHRDLKGHHKFSQVLYQFRNYTLES